MLPELFEAIDYFPEPICVVLKDGSCLHVNRAFRLLLDLSPDADVSAATFWPTLKNLRSHTDEIVTEFFNAAGKGFHVKLNVTEIPSGAKLCRVMSASPKGEVLFNYHAQRLETLGMLAGGVAHDFNNILTGILGHITYLNAVLPETGLHKESLTAIEEGAKKASIITQQILNFSRLDSTSDPEKCDLGDLITKTCMLLRGALPPKIELKVLVPTYTVCALVEEGRIAQAIVNLAVNSRDALKDGSGSIEISLSTVEEREELVKVFKGEELDHGQFARITVKDNGAGMPSDLHERIFDPFFSTKKAGGTGLGLSMVRAVTRLYHGAVFVTSSEGMGTEISLYLPIDTENFDFSDSSENDYSPKDLVRGNERILIVDDEEAVRNILSVSLEHLGYEVTAAESGEEAFEIYTSTKKPFDLVIMDMLMPGMSGEELFFALLNKNSALKALAISGFTSPESIGRILSAGGKGFIQKPFTIEELSIKVRECLV